MRRDAPAPIARTDRAPPGRPARSRTAPAPSRPTGCPGRCRRTPPSTQASAPAHRARPHPRSPAMRRAATWYRGTRRPRGAGSGCARRSPTTPRRIARCHRRRCPAGTARDARRAMRCTAPPGHEAPASTSPPAAATASRVRPTPAPPPAPAAQPRWTPTAPRAGLSLRRR